MASRCGRNGVYDDGIRANGKVLESVTKELEKEARAIYRLKDAGEAEPKEEDEKCPTEAKCALFQVGVAEGNGLAACESCHLLPTKPKPKGDGDVERDKNESAGEHDYLFGRVRYLRQQRISGYAAAADEMTWLEWKALIVYDAAMETARIESEVIARHALEENAQMMAAMMQMRAGG